jgi:hypothetical protein
MIAEVQITTLSPPVDPSEQWRLRLRDSKAQTQGSGIDENPLC